jgi:hypothetical protein
VESLLHGERLPEQLTRLGFSPSELAIVGRGSPQGFAGQSLGGGGIAARQTDLALQTQQLDVIETKTVETGEKQSLVDR